MLTTPSLFYEHWFDSVPCTLPEATVLRTGAFGFCMFSAIGCYYATSDMNQPATGAAVVIAGWIVTAEIILGALGWTQFRRRKVLASRNHQDTVIDCGRRMEKLAKMLPANVFTSQWHTQMATTWYRKIDRCTHFPQMVELMS